MTGKKSGICSTQNLLKDTDLSCIDMSEHSLDKSGYLLRFRSIHCGDLSGY